MMERPKKSVAIVADWIIGGGAERVVEQLHKLYPDAPIYTSYCTDEWRNKLDNKVVTGWLQNWPFSVLRKYLGPLRIWYYRSLNLNQYYKIISCTGNGEAKHIKVSKNTKHICYCFTPTHFYWRHYQTYLGNPGFGVFNPLARLGLKLFVKPLRKLDYRAAQRPDQFIAISSHIQSDISKYYNRDSVIIHPPVDIQRFSQVNSNQTKDKSKKDSEYFITVGRQTAYKKTDLIVQACQQLNIKLKVIGRGPEHAKLKQMANQPSSSVEILEDVSDQQVNKLLANSKAFIFAAEEDFGIAPVEALASGVPVIAYAAGGALDFVKPKENGLLFEQQTVESLSDAIAEFNKLSWDKNTIRQSAKQFSAQEFSRKISEL
jgi:glycosyltransferase involved in cell wall biosynthesis